MNKKRRIAIQWVLILIYLINIIPLYVLGVISGFFGLNKAEEYVIESMQSEASLLIQDLDDVFLNIQVQMLDCYNNDDVTRFLWGKEGFSSQYDKFQNTLDVQTLLNNIMWQSDLITDVVLYAPVLGEKLSAINGVDELLPVEAEKVYAYLQNGSIFAFNDEEALYILSSSYKSWIQKKPELIIITKISLDKLAQTIRQYAAEKDNTSLVITYDQDSWIVSDSGNIPSEFDMGQMLSSRGDSLNGSFMLRFGEKYAVTYATSNSGYFILYQINSSGLINNSSKWFLDWLIYFTAATIVTLLLFIYISRKSIRVPISRMIRALSRVESGNYEVLSNSERGKEFFQLNESFNKMTMRIRHLVNAELKYQYLLKEAELKTLQMQINPHFLFNTYFILNSLVQNGNDIMVERLTKLLGTYLEYIARETDKDVSLLREANHVRTYMEIQMMRFSKRMKLEFGEVPQDAEEIRVPKLMLQPLVENAFEHGVKSLLNAFIRVDFLYEKNVLVIDVEDNGDQISDDDIDQINHILSGERKEGEGIALVNIHKRLQIMYGKKSGLTAARSELGGLKMAIRIEGGCLI